MKPLDMALALGVAVVWGMAFVVSKVGLQTFSPAELTTLRFLVAALAVLWLPRPAISWRLIVFIGLTMFTGQFLLQFFGMAMGLPAGLTAVVTQTQALFTVVFAAIVLGDRPSRRQLIGMVTALVGLGLIGFTLDLSATLIGFTLTLASAISWAIGNVAVKRLPRPNMLHVMAWSSLIPPLPAFLISLVLDGPGHFSHVLSSASWSAFAAPVYLGLVATVVAYAVWGRLLQHYSSALVAPFALLSPCVGAIVSFLVSGERFGLVRASGMILILVGVAISVIPLHRFTKRSPGRSLSARLISHIPISRAGDRTGPPNIRPACCARPIGRRPNGLGW